MHRDRGDDDDNDDGNGNDDGNDCDPLPLLHGTVVRIDRARVSGSAANKNAIANAMSNDNHNDDDDDDNHNHNDLTLMYRAPRSLDCPANRAVSGWEVYCCDATFASALWLALVTFDDNTNNNNNNNKHDNNNGNNNNTGNNTGNNKRAHSRPLQKRVRGCCAIGLVEDSHLRLECEPPIPVFPRDCVDTRASQEYWMPACSSSSSWKRIRQLYEGGWGRLPIDKTFRLDKLRSVDFRGLVGVGVDVDVDVGVDVDEGDSTGTKDGVPAATNTTDDIVVVRGAFGRPFVDAIRRCCGRYTPRKPGNNNNNNGNNTNGGEKGRHRRRRNRRPGNRVVVAPPMSREDRASFGELCRGMSSSLALPAVLLVHVRAVDKGTICSGMRIFGADHDNNNNDNSVGVEANRGGGLSLGTITTGGFSIGRGVCHGTGVVGAVRLLDYLARSTGSGAVAIANHNHNGLTGGDGDDEETSTDNDNDSGGKILDCGRVVPLANGSQSLQLLVRVGNEYNGSTECRRSETTGGCEACLSVILG